jgi:hypothetical protein
MLTPNVNPGMEQPDQFSRDGIYARDVRSLVPIAVRARQRKILFYTLPAMLLGNDVIDLKRKRQAKLWNPAVLATIRRAPPNLVNQLPVH